MDGVSVIITAHSEGNSLIPAINSALINTDALENGLNINTEILLILDKANSHTINTANIFRNYKTIRTHFVNFGDPSLARNFGVENSKFELISFLDGDDIWGRNWLTESFEMFKKGSKSSILHPAFNFYFSENNMKGTNRVFKHVSMNSPEFDRNVLISQNYWTALSFGAKSTYIENPFLENDKNLHLGFEDWSFNLQTISNGYIHLSVPNTVHFIREKSSHSVRDIHFKSESTFMHFDIWSKN